MQGIQAKQVFKYMILPGVVPRAKNLFASGFGYIAFLMANIYSTVRLLPNNHPYLNPENIGKYGIRHVVAEAANNLIISKKNLDQLFIFVMLMAGIVILFLQFGLLIWAYIFQPAFALSFFDTPSPSTGGPMTDIAFLLMDNVFGVPNFFCNLAGQCTNVLAAGRFPFHIALHEMFRFYSIGLLLIAVIIFLYFIFVVTLETATTGTPFGQRFQNIWVPVRLVVALGLLVPINYGLNSGQYITLFAAKIGSSFATNAWITFNSTITTGAAGSTVFAGGAGANPLGERTSLLARPGDPDISPVVAFMSVVHGCAYAYWRESEDWLRGGLANPTAGSIIAHSSKPPQNNPPLNAPPQIRPYFVKNVLPWMGNLNPVQEITNATTYAQGLNFYDNGDIIIRFGRVYENTSNTDQEDFKKYRGNVEPTCGEIRINITDLSNVGTGATTGGSDAMQEAYFDLVRNMWFNENTLLVQLSHRYTEIALGNDGNLRLQCSIGCGFPELPACPNNCRQDSPAVTAKQTAVNFQQGNVNTAIVTAWNNYNNNALDLQMDPLIIDRGWGGAGIWYNKIAQMNGAFIGAVMNIPSISKYPLVMENVLEEKMAHDGFVSGKDQFTPNLSDGKSVSGLSEDTKIAKALNDLFGYWASGGANQALTDKTPGGNIFKNFMNMTFGTYGLFDIRDRNQFIHPLAQLTAVGKGLVDSTVRNVAASTGFAVMGGALGGGQSFFGLGPLADMASSFLTSTALVGLTAGFVLFYVLPFLPFLYFYFAVGSWVKSIFEAMVGVPLWALAHLRIDGEGLPGESAANGYFLIFEIFIRPILTVFGLVASLVIFTAQVRVLNFIWGLVVDNVAGAEVDPVVNPLIFGMSIERDIIDQFFYTIIYTIIVYMLATASFKLIDKIPDNLLRWMGAGVSSFSDINDDPAEGLTRYAAFGGLTVGQQAVGGVTQAARGTGGAFRGQLGGMIDTFGRSGGGR